MRRRPRRLAAFAVLWLGCQLATLTVPPLALCADVASVAAACTCAHHGGQPCPMHPSQAPKSPCSCRSTSDQATPGIATLLTPAAILPVFVATPSPAAAEPRPPAAATYPLDRTSVPDAPPPRS